MDNKKAIIGILGGVGSGKSTAASRFARLGCAVIDADKIAHDLLENDNIKQQIKDAFGADVFDDQGNIDRPGLAAKVFESGNDVETINAIIHPPVLERCRQLIDEFNNQPEIKAIVLDIPLLAEAGWAKNCDKLVFVRCKPEIRALRTEKKADFHKNQLKKRENFQISLDNKAKMADYIVDNNSDLSALAEQVERIFTIIINN